MAKLSARGATVLWTVSKVTKSEDDCKVTTFYAMRSDGKLLRRISIRSHNRYTRAWETNSGSYSIVSSAPADALQQLTAKGFVRS